MMVYKCNICKKEINPEVLETEYFLGKRIDLCPICYGRFRNMQNAYRKEEQQMNKEYDLKRNKLYETFLTKCGLKK